MIQRLVRHIMEKVWNDFYVKRTWYLMFDEGPEELFSRVVFLIIPNRLLGRGVASKHYFVDENDRTGLSKYLFKGLTNSYYDMNERDRRHWNKEKLWGGAPGKQWHEVKREEYSGDGGYSDEFLRFRAWLAMEVKTLANSEDYQIICEIGTGNGLYLKYLSEIIDFPINYIGIDINDEIIQRNKELYKDSNLQFRHQELIEFARESNDVGIIFVAYGTLEYFSKSELLTALDRIQQRKKPSAFALGEPTNLDLRKEVKSKPRGKTKYSHNYPHIFKESGYKIIAEKVEPTTDETSQILMVASANNHKGVERD